MAVAAVRHAAIGLLCCLPVALSSGPWEWAATFDLPAGHYTWSFTKQAAGYADPSIRILVVKTAGTDSASLEDVEGNAETLWATPQAKSAYQELEVGTSYTLQMDQDTWTTHFILHVDVAGGHAVFLEHLPYEFENGFHFLQTEGGEDVEPVHEEESDGHGHGGHDGHDHGGHEGHDHGEPEESQCPWSEEWEWAGIFAVSPGKHDWNAEKSVDGGYPDATMRIAVFDTAEASFGALHDAVHAAWDASDAGELLAAGGTIPRNRAITLQFNPHTWASHFKIDVPANGGGHIAVFAQHFPIEFEKNYHYLKDASGADIEPELEQSGADCTTEKEQITTDDLWGEVILASFLTGLPTLLGIFVIVLTMAPAIAKMAEEGGGWLAVVHSFASGVIFAAAVFLLLPEGLYLATVGKTEAGGNGAWGTAIMGGWVFCVIIKHVGQVLAGSAAKEEAAQEGEAPPPGQKEAWETGAEANGSRKGIDWTVGIPIIIGDGFHNIADGLVIGTAFKTCTKSFGWKLTGVTIAHEIPQEISDFCVLITRGRMHWGKAVIFNFLSGLLTVLGAIITYSTDVSPGVEGIILAAGGGVYLYIAMTELGPAVTDLVKGEGGIGSVSRILGFSIGAILLGLILLDHEHCGGEHLLGYAPDAEPAEGEAAEDDPHAGHNHAHR